MNGLHIICGPMYSGKTTRLINNYNDLSYKYKQLIIDYNQEQVDEIKYDKLYNHNNLSINCIKLLHIENIYNIKEFHNIDIIHVNEAQFFLNLFNIVVELVEKYKKTVYIYGLECDYKRETFGDIINLIKNCDSICKLTSICNKCKNIAIFSHRIKNIEGQVVFNNKEENIYIPLCRNCYNKFNIN
jgi:thymidine kinase